MIYCFLLSNSGVRKNMSESLDGEISFKAAASFAAPSYSGKDNTYELDITRTIIPDKKQWRIETLARRFKIVVQSN
jgi:hypothetical protein